MKKYFIDRFSFDDNRYLVLDERGYQVARLNNCKYSYATHLFSSGYEYEISEEELLKAKLLGSFVFLQIDFYAWYKYNA